MQMRALLTAPRSAQTKIGTSARPAAGAEWTRFPIARLRYAKTDRTWTLYWRDRNLRFYLYDRTGPTPDINDLLAEIDADPTAIFWG